MNKEDLSKFFYDFVKENKSKPEFVSKAKVLLENISNFPDQEQSHLFLSRLVDKIELFHLNSLLENKYSPIVEEECVEPDPVPRYFARSKQFKGLYPKSPVLPSPVPMTYVSPPVTLDQSVGRYELDTIESKEQDESEEEENESEEEKEDKLEEQDRPIEHEEPKERIELKEQIKPEERIELKEQIKPEERIELKEQIKPDKLIELKEKIEPIIIIDTEQVVIMPEQGIKIEKETQPEHIVNSDINKRVKRVKGPPVLRSREKKQKIEKKDDKKNKSFFCQAWASSKRPMTVNRLLYHVKDNPDEWLEHMKGRYEVLSNDIELMKNLFNKPTVSLDILCGLYKKYEPSNFRDELEEIKLIAKMKQSCVALVLYKEVKETNDDPEEMRKIFKRLRNTISRSKQTNALWRHCKAAYSYYQELGDMVVFSPEIFDKLFYLQYPDSARQRFIERIKEEIDEKVYRFERLIVLRMM